jgi:hypothetical protein
MVTIALPSVLHMPPRRSQQAGGLHIAWVLPV